MATFLYPAVSVTSLPPLGGATSANQLLEITELEAINLNTAGAMKILRNGVLTEVEKDTTVPSNTVSVPVEITGASGPINITAGDLNVQLSDQGPNADVTRIGNGTNQWGINASNEGLVHDADLLAAVQASSSTKLMSDFLYFDYAGVSDAGYTELIAATLDTIKAFTWFESSGQPMVVALGAVGLEVNKFVIPPGGFNGEISMDIPLGSRISIKQLNAEVLGSGIMIVANFLK